MRPAYDLLRPPPDRRQRPAAWLHPYIRRLRGYRRRLRAGEPRIVASLSLSAILLAATLSFALTPRPGATAETPVNRLAEAGPVRPASVRMLDAAPRSGACEEQTWPYIAPNCLKAGTSTPQTAQAGNAPANPPSNAQTAALQAKPETPSAPAPAPQAAEPASAPQQFANVPLPQPRPQIEDGDDELDAAYYPPDEPRRMDAPPYGYPRGYDPRGAQMPPYAMQDQRLREERRWRNYEDRPQRRARRHGVRIGDFYFRF